MANEAAYHCLYGNTPLLHAPLPAVPPCFFGRTGMGFDDIMAIRAALAEHNGDVDLAIADLIN